MHCALQSPESSGGEIFLDFIIYRMSLHCGAINVLGHYARMLSALKRMKRIDELGSSIPVSNSIDS